MKHTFKIALFALCIYSPMYSMKSENYDQKREYQKQLKKLNKELHDAIKAQDIPLTKNLLEQGANPNSFDHTPFGYLYEEFVKDVSNISIIQLLLRYNANPNLKSEVGRRALHFAFNIDKYKNLDEDNHCHAAQLLIVGGAIHAGKISVAFIAKTVLKRNKLATTIEQTAKQREALFEAVKNGDDVDFVNTNGISRYHVRDIHGNNLLYYALGHDNIPVATKLIALWPQLLAQENFAGKSVFELLPQKCLNLYG